MQDKTKLKGKVHKLLNFISFFAQDKHAAVPQVYSENNRIKLYVRTPVERSDIMFMLEKMLCRPIRTLTR